MNTSTIPATLAQLAEAPILEISNEAANRFINDVINTIATPQEVTAYRNSDNYRWWAQPSAAALIDTELCAEFNERCAELGFPLWEGERAIINCARVNGDPRADVYDIAQRIAGEKTSIFALAPYNRDLEDAVYAAALRVAASDDVDKGVNNLHEQITRLARRAYAEAALVSDVTLSGGRQLGESGLDLVDRLQSGSEKYEDLALVVKSMGPRRRNIDIRAERIWHEYNTAGVVITLAADEHQQWGGPWAARLKYRVEVMDDGYIHILPSEGELLMVDNGTVTRYTGTVISEALEGGLWRRWGVDGWEWLAENGDDPTYGSEPSGWLVEMLTGYQADN